MENKCLKKSTMQQLQALVTYMEENPELARGTPVFGANKFAVNEQWKNVCKKVNALGPPSRSISEWKKTWADLKCRTKKKIGENKKSLQETGGGLYKCNHLSSLEQIIDRTLLLSSAAAPSGRIFGDDVKSSAAQSVDECFQLLVESPPRVPKAVAVITPNKINTQEKASEEKDLLQSADLPQTLQQHPTDNRNISKRDRAHQSDSDNERPACSSGKKRKTAVDEQLALIRRQLRVAEKNASTAREQADAIKRLADAAEVQAASAKRKADATEVQLNCIKSISESMQRLEQNIECFMLNFKK